MKATIQVEDRDLVSLEEAVVTERRSQLVAEGLGKITASHTHNGVVTGDLIGMRDDGCTPLVMYPGQIGSAAIPARSVVDLHAVHIGKQVVLMFEAGDPVRPIVMGVLRGDLSSTLDRRLDQVEVDRDGERMIISAKSQLVLRCGKASITLTQAGKVILEGAYVSNRSSGVLRIKGGSVQIN
jgi:hypothetical protein